jgi:hypothetical protein
MVFPVWQPYPSRYNFGSRRKNEALNEAHPCMKFSFFCFFSVKSDNRNARIASLEGCHLETIRDIENCDNKVGLKSTADSNAAFRIFLSCFVQALGKKNFVISPPLGGVPKI